MYVSVADWSQLQDGVNPAKITFTATSSGYQPLIVNVNFVATKNVLPSGFKGAYACTLHFDLSVRLTDGIL